MANVATQGPVSSDPLHIGTAVKRKTPSELRGEQLKRKTVMELVDDSRPSGFGTQKNTTRIICGLKKPDGLKNPRYVDVRMDEVFPVRKNSIRFRMLSGKENAKEENSPMEHASSLKSCSVPPDSAVKIQPKISCLQDSIASSAVTRNIKLQATEKCGENKFRTVTDLSSGGEKLSGLETVDMDKVLKGLVAHEPTPLSGLASDSSKRCEFTSESLCFEFYIPGQKAPLDFTLKTTMRVMSSSSVNWFHRLITSGACNGVPQFAIASQGSQKISCSAEHTSTTQMPRALSSWVYPQSSLPPSVISALTLSAAEGVQMDFLNKRQLAWEDAFRSLYYMFRKSMCNIFYVCTAQFVVMFIAGDRTKGSKCACNAYVSQSTRSLRSLLREQDIHFSMPLCHSQVETINTEDLVELSEMEKHNLGQIRRLSTISDVDNSSQSCLAFIGNENVHGLYDFLLNYRFFLTSMTGVDVPVLYSPVPFQNGALSSPEVRCKEVRRANNISFLLKESNMNDELNKVSSAGFCYSIEIRDAYLPPWVISSVCEAIGSEGVSFEVSFVTESNSNGLNVGLETICQKFSTSSTEGESLQEGSTSFGIPNTILCPRLSSAFLNGLKYCDGSYRASATPV